MISMNGIQLLAVAMRIMWQILLFIASRSNPYIRPPLAQTHLPTMPTCPAVTGQTPSSTSTSNMPVPMDVDATKHGGVCTLVCYCCSKMGHLGKNCPQVFDVRFMTEEERPDWVQQLLVSADVEKVEEHEGEAEEKVKTEEGFVPNSE